MVQKFQCLDVRNAGARFRNTGHSRVEKVIAPRHGDRRVHSPLTTGISFALLIGAVGGAFAYVSGDPVEIVKPPWFGFRGLPLTADLAELAKIDQQQGFLVMVVEDGSPADVAGLRGGYNYTEVSTSQGVLPLCLGGDLITAMNGDTVTDINQIRELRERSVPGDIVTLTVFRDGGSREISVTLGEDPGIEPPPLKEVCN